MGRSRFAYWQLVLAVTAPLLSPSTVAQAAHPVPSATYLLQQRGDYDAPLHEGALLIADNGRALTSTGHVPFSVNGHGFSRSYIAVALRCGRYRETVYFGFAAPDFSAVALTTRGTFSAIGRGDLSEPYPGFRHDWIRLRGTFVSPRRAVVRVVDGRYLPHGLAGPRCRIPHRTYSFVRAARPHFGSCQSAAGQTLARSPGGRVFRSWGVDATGRSEYAYACLYGGRPIALGWTQQLSAYSVAGSYVSYAEWEYVADFLPNAWYLTVLDLDGRGTIVRDIDEPLPDWKDVAATSYDPRQYPFAAFASSVVTPLGSVAWIASYCTEEQGCSGPRRPGYEVWLLDASGERRADRGSNIDPRSLALQGGVVTWRTGGVGRSAPIDAVSSAG